MDKSSLKKRVYNTGLVLLCALSLGASLHTIKEQTEIKRANNQNIKIMKDQFVKLNKSLESTNKALETTQKSIQAQDTVVQKQIDELKKYQLVK